MATTQQTDEPLVGYCAVHPTVETNLHCNRCGRLMCTRCAVLTPVGYRCRECVRQQQDKFFDAQMIDYLIAGAVSLVISFITAFIVSHMFLGLFGIIIVVLMSSVVGGAIGAAVLRMTRKRRGRYTAPVVGAGVILGGLPFLLVNPLIVLIYLFLVTSTAMAQFRLRL